MGSVPECSVVIPTYNRRELLARTLDSLLRQDLGRDRFEVLVADDGSSDDTGVMVKEYQDQLNLRYFFQPDQGFRAAAARNVGLANALGSVTVFLDSGVLAHSGCLRAHLGNHGGPGPVAVVGYVYCFNHDNEEADLMRRTLDFGDVDGTIRRLSAERRWLDAREEFYQSRQQPLHELPAPWLLYWTCNVSATTEHLRRVGGFDEAFVTWGFEDVDLGYRLWLDGARFVLDRAASAIHHPHPKDFARNKESQMEGRRYIAGKYDTPAARLLTAQPALDFDEIDEILRRQPTTVHRTGPDAP